MNCKKKIYKDRSTAKKAARRYRMMFWVREKAYRCDNCDQIHLTTRNFQQQQFYKRVTARNMKKRAQFSQDTREEMFERDNFKCILCPSRPVDPHHIYFWPHESNYNINRNDIDQWVSLCRSCHDKVHACPSWKGIRQECIDYRNKIYKDVIR